MLPRERLRLCGRQFGFTLIEILIVLVIIGILAGLAIPKFVGATSRAKQVEAKQLLRQISTMQSTYRIEHDEYWIPPFGSKASASNPKVFAPLGVEIMPQARYEYEIVGDRDRFVATATATALDDDPAIDQWTIDQTGELKNVVNDAVE
jgi:prepilin-type N-terminal cleavage/methylation domain-containing protein